LAKVILIPGLLSDGCVWRAVLEGLGGDAQIADLRHAASITDMARSCLAMAEGPLAVAGHSMGGRVAIEMIRLAPRRVQRLALLNTGIHPPDADEVVRRREIINFAREKGMAALAARWLPPMVHRRTEAVMTELTAMVLRMDEDIHERQVMALASRPDARAHLGGIAVPTLVMTGAQDAWSPAAQHRDIAAAIPKSKLAIIEDAGHFAPVEQAGPLAARLVPFLTGTDQNSS